MNVTRRDEAEADELSDPRVRQALARLTCLDADLYAAARRRLRAEGMGAAEDLAAFY